MSKIRTNCNYYIANKAAQFNLIHFCMFNKSIVHGKFALKSDVIDFARPEEIILARFEVNCSPTSRFFKTNFAVAFRWMIRANAFNTCYRTGIQKAVEMFLKTTVQFEVYSMVTVIYNFLE